MRKFYCLLFFCSIGMLAFSQQEDAELRSGIKFNYKLSERWGTRLFVQERIDNNISRLSKLFNNISLDYNVTKHLNFEGTYIFVAGVTERNVPISQHHAIFDLSYKISLLYHLKFKYTGMWQTKLSNYYTSEDGHIPDYYIRNKFQFEYKITKHFQPFCFFEFRNKLNRKQPGTLNRLSYNVGLTYQYNKRIGAELYYLIQQAVQEENPQTSYIIGVNLLISLKHKKRESLEESESQNTDGI